MFNKLSQKYQQKFFRTEQLSPPLRRFRVYPQTLDEVDQESDLFLDFKTAQEEQYGGWFSTGMFGVIMATIIGLSIIIFNQHAHLIDKLLGAAGLVTFAFLVMGVPGI